MHFRLFLGTPSSLEGLGDKASSSVKTHVALVLTGEHTDPSPGLGCFCLLSSYGTRLVSTGIGGSERTSNCGPGYFHKHFYQLGPGIGTDFWLV
jgi:hypothetical protein